MASRGGGRWLARGGMRDHLAGHVRELDRGPVDGDFDGALERAGVRIVRLDGADGVHYLITITPRPGMRLHPLDRLPPSLRKVALAASRGLTDKEVASELDMPLATVRTYMSRLFRRLEVSSRAELARLVATTGP